ncbi:TRAP transporter fused permease subunit [Magnetospira sp. QH-2]|uniref:TRAP transporter permease n=1 Tax=Magnetospira sp. (strain QH-2) TaxID=1288970 RepID=UPI0003E81C08|nr:TRAP transporter fused permease subunit [Magnetospira sp. QH-2]CCQ73180.1 Membrane protein of unknown function [Magnetospira sp. QH-2]
MAESSSPVFTPWGQQSPRGRLLTVLGVGISLLHIWFNVVTLLPNLWQNSLHFAGFALMAVILYPVKRDGGKPWRTFDGLVGIVAAFSAIYMVWMEDAIYDRGVRLALPEWILGTILILIAIELTRRTTGWIIPILILLALSYVGWWGGIIDGVFKFAGLSSETILFRSVYGDDALFGNIARISSTYVFMFILFGAFLLRSGAGEFVIDMARAVAGKTVGGPGLVAVMASGLMGTISGSAVANTASTGVITIPLMKKAGFPGKFAAGVEASASTGGQLMPPIMGAGAFVMATYTQISYNTIVLVSILPAILYFATVAFFVRIEARRSHATQIESETVSLGQIMRQGGLSFVVPVSVLIGLLIYGFTPTYAAGLSILAVIAASWLGPNRMGPMAVIEALALGARNMVMTAVLLCAVGLIVNVIATTGIGNTFSLMITQWAGDSLVIAIVLIALASLVLGMGLPVTAAYIVLGTLSAPALPACADRRRPDGANSHGRDGPRRGQGAVHDGRARSLGGIGRSHDRRGSQEPHGRHSGGSGRDPAGDGVGPRSHAVRLAFGASDRLLAEPGFQRHAAGSPGRLHRCRHCQDPTHGHRSAVLEDCQGALYRALAVCLYAADRGHMGRGVDGIRVCLAGALCLFLGHPGPHGKPAGLAFAGGGVRQCGGAALADHGAGAWGRFDLSGRSCGHECANPTCLVSGSWLWMPWGSSMPPDPLRQRW